MGLAAQVEALRVEVTAHKAEIRRRRERLARAAAELAVLEEQCRRLGIRLIVKGEERTSHGQAAGPQHTH